MRVESNDGYDEGLIDSFLDRLEGCLVDGLPDSKNEAQKCGESVPLACGSNDGSNDCCNDGKKDGSSDQSKEGLRDGRSLPSSCGVDKDSNEGKMDASNYHAEPKMASPFFHG